MLVLRPMPRHGDSGRRSTTIISTSLSRLPFRRTHPYSSLNLQSISPSHTILSHEERNAYGRTFFMSCSFTLSLPCDSISRWAFVIYRVIAMVIRFEGDRLRRG